MWEAGPGVGVSSATQGAPGRSAIEAGCLWGREGRSETKGHGPQAGAPAQGRRGRQAPRPSALRAGLGAAGAGRGRASGPLGKTRAGPAGASREAPGVPAPHAPHAEQKSVSTSVPLGLRQATNGPWRCIFSRQRFRKGGCWTPTDPAREDTRAPPGSHGWCVRATPQPGTRACRAHGRAAVPGQRALSPAAEGRVDHLLATEPS